MLVRWAELHNALVDPFNRSGNGKATLVRFLRQSSGKHGRQQGLEQGDVIPAQKLELVAGVHAAVDRTDPARGGRSAAG